MLKVTFQYNDGLHIQNASVDVLPSVGEIVQFYSNRNAYKVLKVMHLVGKSEQNHSIVIKLQEIAL